MRKCRLGVLSAFFLFMSACKNHFLRQLFWLRTTVDERHALKRGHFCVFHSANKPSSQPTNQSDRQSDRQTVHLFYFSLFWQCIKLFLTRCSLLLRLFFIQNESFLCQMEAICAGWHRQISSQRD